MTMPVAKHSHPGGSHEGTVITISDSAPQLKSEISDGT